MFSFKATIYKEGMNYVVDVPDSCRSYFQKTGYIPVRGTIDGENYMGTLIPRKGNNYVIFVNWEVRTKINKTEFDDIEVAIDYDPESRELQIPEDVELILSEDNKILQTFLELSTSHRRELIQYVTEAKKTETRLKRIQRIENHLRERMLRKGN